MQIRCSCILVLIALTACGDDDDRARSDAAIGSDATVEAGSLDAAANGGAAATRAMAVDGSAATGDSGELDAGDAEVGSVGTGGHGSSAHDAGPSPPPVSKYCGDAIRDPVLEECDDGAGSQHDTCSADCRVHTLPLFPDVDDEDAGMPPTSSFTFGAGPHIAAAGEGSGALTYAEKLPGTSAVWLQMLDEFGDRTTAPIEVSSGAAPFDPANAVVAALPDERYVIGWTDSSSGTPDVVLRGFDPGRGSLGAWFTAHDNTAGFQQDPDLLWTGERLIAAWTDLLDVRYRAFDGKLRPLGGVQTLASTPGAIESSVTLATFGDGWAAAFRSNEDALERIRVIAGSASWSTSPQPPGPLGDRPALVELDSEHILLFFTIGTDPLGSGSAGIGRLRVAVLRKSAPGNASAAEFVPMLAPYSSDVTLAQRRPSATRVGDRIYVAWESTSAASSMHGAAFLAQIEFDPGTQTIVQHEERQLPLEGPREDERNPRVDASPLYPGGALITVWEAVVGAQANSADLMIDFRPSPFVFLNPSPKL